MCGIAGFIEKNNCNSDKAVRLKRMTDAIAHRGPDAEGQWIENQVALGHRRLAIIDIDPRSSQPMISNDHRFVIVFNGEIYNYIELRQELERLGATFRTQSDTEVIVEAYRQYGVSCFSKFNGMWALCLYDRGKEEVILSRDRFGIKPLYCLDREDCFAFSSEAKGIIAAFPEENIPNNLALHRFLSGGLNENIDEVSFYKNIKIFPPAKYMVYDLKTHQKQNYSYWDVDVEAFYDRWVKGKNPIYVFKSLFDDSVGLRLRADVEVGACLSGGLDSSSIVGCATKKYKKKMHTFSSVYSDKECNEEEYINAVNELCESKSHVIKPDDEEAHFTEHIKQINYYHDGPAAGASLYSQYMVMRGIKGHVKVVLDGQGADELFAGYIPYYSYYIEDLLDEGGIINRIKAIKLLNVVKNQWPDVIGAISTDQIVRLIGVDNSCLFQNETRGRNEQIRRQAVMFTDDFMDKIEERFDRKDIICGSALNTRLCNDVLSKSIPALLHNEDSNSMAFSIESRVPFLDYRIVEFAIALEGKYKIKDQWTKWIVRKALKDYLPNKVANRVNKMGFPAPFSRWLREGKSKQELKNVIFAFGKRNIVPMETIEFYYSKHMLGECDLSDILFKYYSTELWLRTCA